MAPGAQEYVKCLYCGLILKFCAVVWATLAVKVGWHSAEVSANKDPNFGWDGLATQELLTSEAHILSSWGPLG